MKSERLDLELYAERVARLVKCAADDLADARLRLAWCDLEHGIRAGLPEDMTERLQGVGALQHEEARERVADTVREREKDLAALHALQMAVEVRRGRFAVAVDVDPDAAQRARVLETVTTIVDGPEVDNRD